MTAGVDFWPYELAVDDEQKAIRQATEVHDDRLRNRLKAVLKRDIEFLLSPTEGKRPGDPSGHHRTPMNFSGFNLAKLPRCNVLKQHGLELVNSPRCSSHHRLLEGSGVRCSELPQRARKIMKPVRFLIA